MQGSPSTKMIKTQLGDIAQSFCKTLHQLYHDKCKCFGKGSDRNTRLFQSPTAAARLNLCASVIVMSKIFLNVNKILCDIFILTMLKFRFPS